MRPVGTEPFLFYTTAHIVELTGRTARTLPELRDRIREVTGSSIFHHTFGALQDRPFAAHRYTSDFARWTSEVLQDWPVAERLAFMDPTEFPSIRELRERILQVIDDRLIEEGETVPAPPGREFHFSQTISVIYPVGQEARTLPELVTGIRRASARSLFFHLVEARLRIGRCTNDLSCWLSDSLGAPDLARRLDQLDLLVTSTEDLRQQVLAVLEAPA
ncbi:MAG: hypothetical protein HY713_01360 [candidate division NC10 bacterium]|nr:hypothetical protein [candidate division NC10 bacterium]